MTNQKLSNRFEVISLSILLTAAAVFLAPATGLAANRCSRVFSTVFGELDPSFQHNTHYTREVPEQGEILNQCQFGTCHLHSLGSALEQEFKATHHGKTLNISMHYLTARLWLARSLQTLQSPDLNYQVNLGADISESRDFILNVGLIPDGVWEGSKTFEQGEKALRLQKFVQNTIAQAKAVLYGVKDASQRQAILEDAGGQIVDIFKNAGIIFPEKFEYEGQTYTPESFALTYFPELKQKMVSLFVASNPQKTTLLQSKKQNSLSVAISLEKFELIARELLDRGVDLALMYDHDDTYVDMKTGIMSISAFPAPPNSTPLPMPIRVEFFKMPVAGHAVQIVGYDLDPKTNRVIKWKIKNSWGDKVGDHGYFHMYADYFERFADGISYFQQDNLPLPEIEVLAPPEEPAQMNLFEPAK